MAQREFHARGDGQFNVTTGTDVGLEGSVWIGWLFKLIKLLFKGIIFLGKKIVALIKDAKNADSTTTSTTASPTSTESQSQPAQNDNV